MTTKDTLAQRLTEAFLGLQARLGRRLTMADFGAMVARRMARDTPFAAAAVSQWLKGVRVPELDVIQAIADLTGITPGRLAFGEAGEGNGSVPMIDPSAYMQLTSAATTEADLQAMETRGRAKKSAAKKRRRGA